MVSPFMFNVCPNPVGFGSFSTPKRNGLKVVAEVESNKSCANRGAADTATKPNRNRAMERILLGNETANEIPPNFVAVSNGGRDFTRLAAEIT